MDNPLNFTYQGHGSFAQEWVAHRNMTDLWSVQGLLYDEVIPGAAYAFRVSVGVLEVGLGSMASINYMLEDLQSHVQHTCSWLLDKRSQPAMTELHIDAESIIFGESVQLLLDDGVLALRLRGSSVRLDLCLEQTGDEFWYGRDGLLRFHHKQAARGRMYNVVLPQLAVRGRLYQDGDTRPVRGRANFDRLWGHMHLKHGKSHWERFHLFFDNDDELVLTDFPHSLYHAGAWLNKQGGHKVLGEYSLQPTDFQQLESCRFGAGWKLHIPEYRSEVLVLTPYNKEQYRMPVARPLIGIFNEQGQSLGYCFSSLMPGARSQQHNFNFKRFGASPK